LGATLAIVAVVDRRDEVRGWISGATSAGTSSAATTIAVEPSARLPATAVVQPSAPPRTTVSASAPVWTTVPTAAPDRALRTPVTVPVEDLPVAMPPSIPIEALPHAAESDSQNAPAPRPPIGHPRARQK
jgi:hypothetical protein